MNGIIIIDKPLGRTSHDMVYVMRKMTGIKKVGHTGTLDPEATGVLPVCIGSATKVADMLTLSDKCYRAEFVLGMTTDTQDADGEVLTECEVTCSEDEIRQAIMNFVGEIEQIPPMYSAIKQNGKKLYELARKGIEVERKSRKVTINSIDILEINGERVTIDVSCSKGTYIRTLCKDIGEKLGCGGCMSSLIRSRSGNFYLENSIRIDDFKKLVGDGNINDVLIPMDVILKDFNTITVTKEAEKFVVNGNPISKKFLSTKEMDKGGQVVLKDWDNNIVGIYTVEEEFIKPKTMLK